ncbi:relaxase/mobilization nuclease domain-containing protein, partial [Rubrivirga sp. S365]|uniref:relaxase/mobilization nuclease domain-containing protein n=1 Tax=Rubrivirga sp. S365 TaxID=3076080 RepID=UPI0028C5E723
SAVDRTLRDVGLEDHQALVARHVDREHAHVHVMVNRVGPDGRAWSTSNDRRRLRASVERQERELGLRWTGRNARAAGARGQTDRGFAREVRDRALGDFKEAPTWADLDARLQAKGLRIERRGRGAVVTDGKREAKLSSVSRTVSRPRLEARLGSLAAHQRARGTEARNGPGRTAREARGPRGGSQRRATLSRQRRAGALKQNALRTRRVGRAVSRAVVADGERDADEVFAQTALRTGSRVAMRAASRGKARASGGTGQRRAEERSSSHASRTFEARARARDARRGGRLDRMERAVTDHAQTARLMAEREKALRAVACVEGAAASAVARAQKDLGTAQARAAEAKRAFGSSMAETYARPPEAAQAFLRDAQASGADRAVQRMAIAPERYGVLRATPSTSRYSLVRSATTDPARATAPLAAKRGRAFVEARVSVQKAEAIVKQAGETHRTVSAELSGVRDAARQSSVDEFGPAVVRARLERLDKALRERSARTPGVLLTRARVGGPAGKVLASRVGSVGMVTAEKAVKAASRALGRGE